MTQAASKLRILFCESNTDGTVGGSHSCLLYLAEGLDRSRFEPIVAFYEEHSMVPRFRSAGLRTLILDKGEPLILREGFPWRLIQRAVNFGRYLATIRERMRFLKEERIDIVHLNNSIVRHHDWMIATRLTGTPCLTHERGINRSYSWSSRTLGRGLVAIIPMSKAIRDLMIERGVAADNVRVIYDGMDPARFTPTRDPQELRRELGIAPDQPIIGMVGNVREWKGQEVVVRAMGQLLKTRPKLVCLFVGKATPGDQHYVDRLHALMKENGSEANIKFLGYRPNVPDFVNLMDVCVHASVEPEPFGMVVLEAMAMRKPMVGSRAGGVPEMIVEGVTGYTYPPGDWRELAARLDELLSDPARTAAMGERGYQRLVTDFTLRQYLDEMERSYEALGKGLPLPADVGVRN
jgi:glycosyltransferase involved in cell wall biosynthesis